MVCVYTIILYSENHVGCIPEVTPSRMAAHTIQHSPHNSKGPAPLHDSPVELSWSQLYSGASAMTGEVALF